jgi:beta-phosphoglucomutase
MKIKACIFDLDGVIVDTARYHYIAWKSIADELGFEFTHEHNERLKGVSRMRSLEILLEVGGISFDQATKDQLAERKNKLYLEYIHRMDASEILPGSRSLLEELHRQEIFTALGSASKNAELILERLQIRDLFDVVIDGTKVSKAKPDPEVFLLGASELGVLPEECVVFEDAVAGIEAAKAGGMKCVGIGQQDVLGEADLVVPGLNHIRTDFLLEYFE